MNLWLSTSNTYVTPSKKKPFVWQKTDFEPGNCNFKGQVPNPPADQKIETPIKYFHQFMTNHMIQRIAEQSNIFRVKKNGKCPKEIEPVLGMYLLMGLVQMPGVRYYWE